jgi:hypothetical protein
MKSALIVQTNVAVNTILTSKVPFCLEMSMFLKIFGQKRSLYVAISHSEIDEWTGDEC